METKLFTLEEANQLLPQIKAKLEALIQLKLEIQKLQAEIDVVELVYQTGEKEPSEAARATIQGKLSYLDQRATQFREDLRQFADMGCELKDLDHGLVDFYTLRDNKMVYLCWKRGEPQIQFWHDLESGFAGRQPI